MADGIFVADSARTGQNHALRMIPLGEEVLQLVAGNRFDALRRAQDGAASRLVRKGCVVDQIESDVVRTVQRPRDLLQDHLSLFFKFLVREGGILQDVRHDPQRHPLVTLENAREIGRRLEPGSGVEFPSNRLDLLCDILGRPRCGALERHMFEEMREPVLILALMARPGIHPHPERTRLQMRRRLGHDDQTIREPRNFSTHAGAPAERETCST